MSFFEAVKKYEIKRNEAVESFLNSLAKQRENLDKGELNNRSWVKKEGSGFVVKLGKLDNEYALPDRDKLIGFLDEAAAAARNDAEFIAAVEKAYGKGDAKPATTGRRRGRPSKEAREAEIAAAAAGKPESGESGSTKAK